MGVRGEVVRVERAAGAQAPDYDVGVRFLDPAPTVEPAPPSRKAR